MCIYIHISFIRYLHEKYFFTKNIKKEEFEKLIQTVLIFVIRARWNHWIKMRNITLLNNNEEF